MSLRSRPRGKSPQPSVPTSVRRGTSYHLNLELLEDRVVPTTDFRPITGVGNNLTHPTWGTAQTQFLRNTTVGYADGIAAPDGVGLPSARLISNLIATQGALDLPSQRGLTSFVFVWGQFIDHDLDLTGTASPQEVFNIAVPTGDPRLDPLGTGTKFIGFRRSRFDATTGTGAGNPREQVNTITSFMDGSMVYGSDETRALALRTGTGGLMKTSAGDLLPLNTMGLSNVNLSGLPANQVFVAGDLRVNENIALTAMQTLFVREHNFWAAHFGAQDPGLSDEQLYQQARQMVIAEIQAITYNEFLPAMLGQDALAPYMGYRADVNPAVSNIFATAGYRVGHTMLPSNLLRLDASGASIAQGPVALRDAFFTPQRITNEGGIDPILRGLAAQVQQEVDARLVDDVRDFLRDGAPSLSAVDLAALNIQRGRDHGMPSYNQARRDFGLTPVTSFAEITADTELQAALASVYGTVDQVDVWVGGICEDHLPGSSMGPLFSAICRDQFERSRDGDRFWYQRQLSGAQLQAVEKTTLAEVIRRNTGITGLQENVFFDRSVMYYKVPEGQGAVDLTLRRNGSNLRLYDQRTGQVVRSQALDQTSAVIVVGNDFQADRLTVHYGLGGAFTLSGGIVFAGGQGGNDIYRVWGGTGNQNYAVLGNQVTMGELTAELTSVEVVGFVGQAGHDTYQLGTSNSQINISDAGGNDTLDFTQAPGRVNVDLGRSAGQSQSIGSGVTLRLAGQVENLHGSAFDDYLRGNAVANQLWGGGGNDLLAGLDGADYLDGGEGQDTLLGGTGHDILLGGNGDDSLAGSVGRDLLVGGMGGDQLAGDDGEDLLLCGMTSHENDRTALEALRSEWISTRHYLTRVANLRDGSGSADRRNGSLFLQRGGMNPTVFEDVALDLMRGGGDRDWMFYLYGDLAPDRGASEQVN